MDILVPAKVWIQGLTVFDAHAPLEGWSDTSSNGKTLSFLMNIPSTLIDRDPDHWINDQCSVLDLVEDLAYNNVLTIMQYQLPDKDVQSVCWGNLQWTRA